MNYTELSDKVIELSHLSHKEILEYVETQGNDEFLVDLKMIIDICEKDSDYSIKDFLELQRKFKRIAILDILSTTVKDRKLFEEIRDTIMGNKLSKLDHIKNVVKNLRDYVGVSDCAVKEFGEVMTPIELVEEMLDTLPADVWSNPNLKWLDPANGVGIFPCVVVYRLMEGLKEFEPNEDLRYKHIMENMLYVCELQTKNMFIYQTGFDPYDEIELNIHNGSFLDEGFEEKMKIWGVEKFDIVVGNPPYNNGLYLKFIEKTILISNINLFVVPSTFTLNKSEQKYLNLLKNNGLNQVRFLGFSAFNVNISTLYYLLNKRDKNTSILINKNIEIDITEDIRDYSSKIEYDILNKINKLEKLELYQGKNETLNYTNPKEKEYIKITSNEKCNIKMLSRLGGGRNIEYYYIDKDKDVNKSNKLVFPRGTANYNSITNHKNLSKDLVFNMYVDENTPISKSLMYFKVKNKEESDRLSWYISRSKWVRYVLIKYNTFEELTKKIINTFVPAIPLDVDFGDDDVYKYFGFTFEEILVIEKTISN